MSEIGSQVHNVETNVIAVLNTAEPGVRTSSSPYDILHIVEEHQHSPAKVWPTGAAGVTLTCGDAAAWTLGAFVEVVPASSIGDDFDIHFVSIEGVSVEATFELVLYAVEVEIGRIRFTTVGVANNVTLPTLPIQGTIQAADTQIKAKIMSNSGNADTATISVYYHEY